MAGDWIKIRVDLPNDPAVFRMAAMMAVDRHSVVGMLVSFWAWCDRHAVDGCVDGAASTDVDAVVSRDGFSHAMQAVKWLEVVPAGLAIPHFERHNGAAAKARSNKSLRQEKWRQNQAAAPPPTPPPKARKRVDALVDAGASTREEKSINTPKPPNDESFGGDVLAAKPRGPTALRTWLELCMGCGEKPIPPTDPAFAYAAKAGIEADVVALHWAEFKARHLDGGKRYSDWRRAFANSLRANWYGLWAIDPDGSCRLTAKGQQAKRVHESEQRTEQAA